MSIAFLEQPGFPFPWGGFWPSALEGVTGGVPAEMRHTDQALQAPQRSSRSQPGYPALLDVQRRVPRERFHAPALPLGQNSASKWSKPSAAPLREGEYRNCTYTAIRLD